MKMERVRCSVCGTAVSNLVIPAKTPNNPKGLLIVRAWVTCPECIEVLDKVNFAKEMFKDFKESK